MGSENLISVGFYGRRKLKTEYAEINSFNVVAALKEVLPSFTTNLAEIEYLHNYYKGMQPILGKVKTVRPEINYKISVNRANEIVSFKQGYLVGEPLQYVLRNDFKDYIDGIHKLNDFMLIQKKPRRDLQLANWMYICGTAFRMVLPNPKYRLFDDEAPFTLKTLNPKTAFVVYNLSDDDEPVMGVKINIEKTPIEEKTVYNVYTKNMFFVIKDWEVKQATPHILGNIPIIEYPLNDDRLGAFEIVLPLLDAINVTASGRLDGVEQFINSLMKMKNADITTEDFEKLKDLGCIKIKDNGGNADVEFMEQNLDQTQIQKLVDWEYDAVLTIVGMPNRNGGSSTSDTGAAVIMRDGWSDAESRAKDDEASFKDSETSFLKLVLRILDILTGVKLPLSGIDTRFTRRNYENIEQKSTVLVAMLSSNKIHPKLAFEHCGMFTDPTLAYEMSKEYAEEQERKAQAQKQTGQGDGNNGGNNGTN